MLKALVLSSSNAGGPIVSTATNGSGGPMNLVHTGPTDPLIYHDVVINIHAVVTVNTYGGAQLQITDGTTTKIIGSSGSLGIGIFRVRLQGKATPWQLKVGTGGLGWSGEILTTGQVSEITNSI